EVREPLVPVGADERDASLAAASVEGHDDLVLAPLLRGVRPRVPDLYTARTVLPARDLAFEARILERVVLGPHREVVAPRVGRLALGQCPAHEHPVALEPEVEVLAPRVVLLDHEGAT